MTLQQRWDSAIKAMDEDNKTHGLLKVVTRHAAILQLDIYFECLEHECDAWVWPEGQTFIMSAKR